jgi:hypothetical protein
MKAVTLSQSELAIALQKVDQKYGRKTGGRILELLARQKNVPAVIINRKCAASNISATVYRDINPRILPLGLFVACQRPLQPLKNQFGEPSHMHLWSLYRIDEAANDPVYNQSGE